jgi:hypothetical protein
MWASFDDVIDRWVGDESPLDSNLVTVLLDDAAAVILSEFPKIQARIDAGSLPLQTVTLVQVRMVSRVLRNPENLTYWQQQTGPYGQSRNFGSNNQDIWLSAEERQMLSPKRGGKAFSVNLAPSAQAWADMTVSSQPLEVANE